MLNEISESMRGILKNLEKEFYTVHRITTAVRREPHETKRLEDAQKNVTVYIGLLAQEIAKIEGYANQDQQSQGPAI